MDDGGVPGTAPEPDYYYRARITPESVRIFPAKTFDVIESVSLNVVNNPNYSAEDREIAHQALRDLPKMRRLLTAPIAPPENALYVQQSDPRSGWASWNSGNSPTSAELWDLVSKSGTNATGALFGAPPGSANGASLFGGGAGSAAENAGECGKEVWEWAKSLIAITTGVVTIAGGVTVTSASYGVAAPIAWGVVTGGVAILGVGIGDLYFANDAMWKCMASLSTKHLYPK